MTATDSNGLFTSKVVNIFPRKSEITLATSPSGLGMVIDGVPVSTPRTVTGVEGFQRELCGAEQCRRIGRHRAAIRRLVRWQEHSPYHHDAGRRHDLHSDVRAVATFHRRVLRQQDILRGSSADRQDPNINFVWGDGSPDPALPADNFSVRWTKTQWFGAGRYTFTALADDGVRLYIDGKRVIGQWLGPANTEFSYIVELGEGMHTIKMDYVEYGGGAQAIAQLGRRDRPPIRHLPGGVLERGAAWTQRQIPDTTPDLVRDEDAIDHDWGDGSPGAGIGSNRFVARWTRTVSFAPGDYEFAVTADDGVRLYVDGVRVIDKWIDQGPTTYRATLPLDGGPHKIVMEYYENGGGAVARLAIYRRSVIHRPRRRITRSTGTHRMPQEYPDIPTGQPDLERNDETLDFDWGDGSPGTGITPNRFVARWTKTVKLSAGVYRFSGVRDDGMRAYIDNVPMVDQWTLWQHRVQRRQGRCPAANTSYVWSTLRLAAARERSSPTTGSVRP